MVFFGPKICKIFITNFEGEFLNELSIKEEIIVIVGNNIAIYYITIIFLSSINCIDSNSVYRVVNHIVDVETYI